MLREWARWNYTGLEAKPLWPAFLRLAESLRGGVGDPRVAVEYSAEHEQAGSIRMYETLPFFSGRSTLEGVYNQASLSTHAVYYLASELDALAPNPFRTREYSAFDTDAAVRHLRLFAADTVVALSPQLVAALEARADFEPLAAFPPYHVFRLRGPRPEYVEPVAFEPVRSSPRGFRDKAYRWFARKPASDVPLVFSDDPRFALLEDDEWLPPRAVPLPGGVHVSSTLLAEELRISTDRPGHPLLVRVSYHPRWRAYGADGPFLAAPGLMLVIPREREVRLRYERGLSDGVGLALSLAALGVCAFGRRLLPRAPDGAPCARRAWGGLVPAGLLLGLCGLGLVPVGDPRAREAEDLRWRASAACAAGRCRDAAEYARHAAARAQGQDVRAGWLCLRGEQLLCAGDALAAARAFGDALASKSASAERRALTGLVRAYANGVDPDLEGMYRERVERDFAGQPPLEPSCSPGP